MALKGLLDKLTGKQDRGPWQPQTGPFPRLTMLDENALAPLKNKGGVYALWHRGVRPQWIYIGHGQDLAEILVVAQSDEDVALYDLNDGVYVSWAECPPPDRPATVAYLRSLLQPAMTETSLEELGPVDPETKPKEFPPPED